MEKPRGHGDFAAAIRRTWSDRELRQAAQEIRALQAHPGYEHLCALFETRERMLIDRLVVEAPTSENVRATDQTLGTIGGLQQTRRAIDSILYESEQARERAEAAAREADAERSPTT